MEELTIVEEQRQKLIKQCEGTVSEDGTQYTFTEENGLKFQTEMEKLLVTPIKLTCFEPIPIADLGSVTLSPNELLGIEPLLKLD